MLYLTLNNVRRVLGGTPILLGSGGGNTAGYVGYFDSSGNLTGEVDLKYDATLNRLGVATGSATLAYTIQLGGNDNTALGLGITPNAGDQSGGLFTIRAQNATATVATNRNGGGLILSGGQSTGTGNSIVYVQVAQPGSSGATANTPTNHTRFLGATGIISTEIIGGTLSIKQGSNGKTGTITATGTTPVTVSNTSITADSGIFFTLKTVGGTVGAYPTIKTITPSTGFTVTCTASDTSVYNYHIIEANA